MCVIVMCVGCALESAFFLSSHTLHTYIYTYTHAHARTHLPLPVACGRATGVLKLCGRPYTPASHIPRQQSRISKLKRTKEEEEEESGEERWSIACVSMLL